MSALYRLFWRRGRAGWLLAALLLLQATGVRAMPTSAPAVDNRDSTLTTPTNYPAPWRPDGPLTVEQALQRALESDAQIASLKAAVEIARQQRLAATDIKDPELQAQSRSSRASESVSSDELDNSRLGVGVYVPNPWLMVPSVDARTADYQAAQADLSNATWQVNCAVRRLFAQLDYLTNDLAFNTDRMRLNGEVLNALQARVGQGAATVSDLMTASRQYVQSQDDYDQINHQYQLARRQLASLLDIPPDSFELATNPAEVPSLPEPGLSLQQAETMAANSRCDLAALRWRAEAAEYSYHEIRNEKIPWIKEVQAGYEDNSGNASDKYWVGLAVDVPIFSWTKNHADDVALAKAALASVDLTNGIRLIRIDLRDAMDELGEARRQQARCDSSVSPLVSSMRQTLATLKSTPNIMPQEVAAAELQLVETLRFVLDTHWQYQLALFNLERTIGTPLNQ